MDLTKQAPRSPRVRLHGLAILPRMIDKCRAEIKGTNGEYHYACPLDQGLLSFTGVDAEDFKEQVKLEKSDDELATWFTEKAGIELVDRLVWSNEQCNNYPGLADDPNDYIVKSMVELGLDPKKNTSADWLDVDDWKSYE